MGLSKKFRSSLPFQYAHRESLQRRKFRGNKKSVLLLMDGTQVGLGLAEPVPLMVSVYQLPGSNCSMSQRDEQRMDKLRGFKVNDYLLSN